MAMRFTCAIPSIVLPALFVGAFALLGYGGQPQDEAILRNATNFDLAALADRPTLRRLEIQGDQVTNDGLLPLGQLTNLEALRLTCPNVTLEGLKYLRGLTRLSTIDLDFRHEGVDTRNAGGAGLRYLDGLPIRKFALRSFSIPSLSLFPLRGCTSLEDLTIECTFFDARSPARRLDYLSGLRRLEVHCERGGFAAMVPSVGSLRKLEDLTLATPIDDDDLKALQNLMALRRLDLSNTGITDFGLSYLSALTSLRELRLAGTRVTGRGLDRLKSALPGCQVSN